MWQNGLFLNIQLNNLIKLTHQRVYIQYGISIFFNLIQIINK